MNYVKVFNCNTPSFVTFPIAYFVGDEQLPVFIEKHSLYYDTNPISASIWNKKTISSSSHEKTIKNGWDCNCLFRLKNLKAEVIWVECEEMFYRAYKLQSDIWMYHDFLEKWTDEFGIYGNRVFKIESNHISSEVYHIEKSFETKIAMEQDIKEFEEIIDVTAFLEDIVGEAG